MTKRSTKRSTRSTRSSAPAPEATDRPRKLRCILIFLGATIFVLGIIRLIMMLNDPKVPLLINGRDAAWIVLDRPLDTQTRLPGTVINGFRTTIDIVATPTRANLEFWMMRAGAVEIDGQVVYASQPDLQDWKRARHIDLAPYL